jgi:hypothetical protein
MSVKEFVKRKFYTLRVGQKSLTYGTFKSYISRMGHLSLT